MDFFSNAKYLENVKITNIKQKNNIIIENERNVVIIPSNPKKKYIIKYTKNSKYYSIFLRNESWFYNWVYSNTNLAAIYKLIPDFYGSFQDNSILAIEKLSNYESIHTFHKRNKKISKYLIRNLANNLAEIHLIGLLDTNKQKNVIPKFDTKIPLINKITPEYLAHNEYSLVELLQILQNSIEFSKLEKFQKPHNYRCLIHGDLKFDNILKLKSGKNNTRKIIFIDWELCGLGDPEYDIGTVFANLFIYWINSIKLSAKKELESWQDYAKTPFIDIQQLILEFWIYYSKKINQDAKNLHINTKLIFEYVGVVLIQYIYSKTVLGNKLSYRDLLALILTKTFLTKPSITTKIFQLE